MKDVYWLAAVILAIIILTFCKMSISQPNSQIIWFYRDNCGYCSQMNNEWDHFTKIAPKYFNIKKVDTANPANQKMSRDYGVKSVPHIVKEKDGIKTIYNGSRKASDLLSWSIK